MTFLLLHPLRTLGNLCDSIGETTDPEPRNYVLTHDDDFLIGGLQETTKDDSRSRVHALRDGLSVCLPGSDLQDIFSYQDNHVQEGTLVPCLVLKHIVILKPPSTNRFLKMHL